LKVATARDSWPARRLEHTASRSVAHEFSGSSCLRVL